jgi:uncharacterized membrane protein
MAYLAGRHPEEYQAIGWINEHLQTGIIVEAVGGSYSEFGRISTHTGLSTVIEWQGHEFQWRGSFAEQGTRATDVERLYKTRDWREARSIIQQYGIDYVYIGRLERNTYQPLDERKFRTFMDLIYENSQVMVFAAQHGEPVQ